MDAQAIPPVNAPSLNFRADLQAGCPPAYPSTGDSTGLDLPLENRPSHVTIIGDMRIMIQRKSQLRVLTKALQYLVRLSTQVRDRWDTASERSRIESEVCRHNGQPPYCLTCTSVYIRMP